MEILGQQSLTPDSETARDEMSSTVGDEIKLDIEWRREMRGTQTSGWAPERSHTAVGQIRQMYIIQTLMGVKVRFVFINILKFILKFNHA